uniref:Uncharacterized protein n=1 Tax=Rhizophora mucronata TaxID=61149 RepID=A0A2P2N3H4_RHIMU
MQTKSMQELSLFASEKINNSIAFFLTKREHIHTFLHSSSINLLWVKKIHISHLHKSAT